MQKIETFECFDFDIAKWHLFIFALFKNHLLILLAIHSHDQYWSLFSHIYPTFQILTKTL